MLSLKNRLKKGKDFDRVYKKGRSVFFEGLFVKFAENGLGESRIGFSVGVSFSKKAVIRNKVKRQLRAIMRQEIKNLKKGLDIIVIPQKIAQSETGREIGKKVGGVFKKGKLYNK